ncbi:hypothetical protein BGZ94_001438 [Podila epigama]|nr:hypothetical protein BGZ94_001438 [Podila epigama]
MNTAAPIINRSNTISDDNDEETTVCAIETFAEHWSETQAFSVATLTACAITALETTGVDTLPWKHTFLRSLFQQLGITSREEQEMLLLLQENGSYQDCNLQLLAQPLLPQAYHFDSTTHLSTGSTDHDSSPHRTSTSNQSMPISSPPPSPSRARKSPSQSQKHSEASSQEQDDYDIRAEVINDLVYIGLGFEPSTKTRKNVYIPVLDQSGRFDLPPAYSEKDPSPLPPQLPARNNDTDTYHLEPSAFPPELPPRMPSTRSTDSTAKVSAIQKKKRISGRVPPLEYDARARAIIFIICNYLLLSFDTFMIIEKKIAQHLYFYQQELAEADIQKKEQERRQQEEEKILEQQRIRDSQLILGDEGQGGHGGGRGVTAGARGFFNNLKQNISSIGASTSTTSTTPVDSHNNPTRSIQRAPTQHEIAMQSQAQSSMQEMEKKKKTWRYLATGLSVAAGATVIGLTGGLAAPLVAAGATVLIGSGAAVLGTTAGLAVMTSLFGLAGGGLADLKALSFTPIIKDPTLPMIPSLHLAIVISGYLFDESQITDAWASTAEHALEGNDVYHLTFEPVELVTLGNAVKVFVATEAVRVVSTQVIQQTVFAALASALVLPLGLMRAGDLIDNPWVVAMDRARKAGYVLADILMERVQGARPTTLIGYSTGAVVIWECLQELAKRKEYGLVNSVVLLGAPIKTDLVENWKAASSVVSNRFVNGYSKNDVVLGTIFRLHSMGLDVAGLRSVDSVPRIENVDLTDIVGGHLEYRENLNMIVSLLGVL